MKQISTDIGPQNTLQRDTADSFQFTDLPYVFDGPFMFPENLLAEPGVFVIFSTRDSSFYLLGEGTNIKMLAMQTRDSHDWAKKCPAGTFQYIATYTGESSKKRKVIEKQLRMIIRRETGNAK